MIAFNIHGKCACRGKRRKSGWRVALVNPSGGIQGMMWEERFRAPGTMS